MSRLQGKWTSKLANHPQLLKSVIQSGDRVRVAVWCVAVWCERVWCYLKLLSFLSWQLSERRRRWLTASMCARGTTRSTESCRCPRWRLAWPCSNGPAVETQRRSSDEDGKLSRAFDYLSLGRTRSSERWMMARVKMVWKNRLCKLDRNKVMIHDGICIRRGQKKSRKRWVHYTCCECQIISR